MKEQTHETNLCPRTPEIRRNLTQSKAMDIREMIRFLAINGNNGNAELAASKTRTRCARFWYFLAKIFGKRLAIKTLPWLFRTGLKWQIRWYLCGCDVVTTSRIEDNRKYARPKRSVYHLPLACDHDQFRIFDQDTSNFIKQVNAALCKSNEPLTEHAANELRRFTANSEGRRPVLYIGRLSREKNIYFLLEACKKVCNDYGLKERVCFLFVGTGIAQRDATNQLPGRSFATGLVPNWFLPSIYNLIRQKSGFFVSASDTETFGITHEEATACGVPVIAMERGTRKHVFVPGDIVGGSPVESDSNISSAIDVIQKQSHGGNADYAIGLNGLVIPDYCGERPMPTLSETDSRRNRILESLAAAIFLMSSLPENVLQRMSKHAAAFSQKAQYTWAETWSLLRKVYEGTPPNDSAYRQVIEPKEHLWERG